LKRKERRNSFRQSACDRSTTCGQVTSHAFAVLRRFTSLEVDLGETLTNGWGVGHLDLDPWWGKSACPFIVSGVKQHSVVSDTLRSGRPGRKGMTAGESAPPYVRQRRDEGR
jgi:hypothetical protein